jgi:hypothetical protein
MKKILIAFLGGVLIGGGVVIAWTQIEAREREDRESLQAAGREAELRRLRAELANERSAAGDLRRQIETAGIDPSPVKENELDIQRLLNDARPLMKSLALMFGEQRKTMTGRWIRSTAEKLAEEMGLTEEQTNEMIAHFLKLDEENFAKIKSMLDRPLTILDIFTTMKDMNPQKSMDDYVMTKLTDDQKKAWEGRKLETKAQQVERSANRQLERMSRLDLDEDQKDRVFDILVKKNPQYDSSMAVEGVTTDGAEMDAKKSQDEAIAEVLRPEQIEQWTQMQERRNNERQRWTDALGGFDPGQFFQGMEDGMGWRGRGRRGR